MVSTEKSSKKRPATSQAGRATKKAKSEAVSAQKLSASAEKHKKRSLPVTAAVDDNSNDESEEEENDMDQEEEEGDFDGDVNAKSSKQPGSLSSRESHKAQKALASQRKAAKPHSDLITEAKRLWHLAQRRNITPAERQKHIESLVNVIRGRVKDIVLKHDASRIVQTVVKYGKQKERDEVAGELKGSYKELAQGKYSKFLVTKIIRLCPAHRAFILQEFTGHVIRLLLHREASSVIADSYELYANAYERSILLRDFYGKEAILFSVTSGSDKDKERAKKGLKGVLAGNQGESKKRVLGALKENLLTIFNNPDKGAVTHAIVHHVLWEYVAEVGEMEEEEQEKLRREMFETCQEVLAEMVHTKDGSRVVREFTAQGSAKDRKHIIKAIKPHIERMCKDDEAQLVLFTALDTVDDTKLLVKSLISDITSSASSLYVSAQGRRALFYLIVPRSKRYFTPAQIALLAETDDAKKKTSKKDDDVRREEIRKAASEGLLKWVEAEGCEAIRDTGGSLVVLEVMLYADGDKAAASQALLKPLSAPYPSTSSDKPHLIDLSHASRVYKSLLQGGRYDHSASAVSLSPYFSGSTFASAFIQLVGEDATVAMSKGSGAFVVAELIHRIKEQGTEEEKTTLQSWFTGSVKEEIEGSEVKGKKLLLDEVSTLC